MKRLTAVQYHGGKSALRFVGPWIVSHLPTDCGLYVEPFCGMLGIMLQRPAAPEEIASDLNPRLVNWWRCVRGVPDIMERLAMRTPNSRHLQVKAQHALESKADCLPSTVEDAWNYWITLQFGYKRYWKRQVRPSNTSERWSGSVTTLKAVPDFRALSERVRNVQFDERDAVDMLRYTADRRDSLVYCDPPYAGTDGENYDLRHERRNTGSPLARDTHMPLNRLAMTGALLAHKGRVAVSGRPGEWDHLGWRLETMDRAVQSSLMSKGLNTRIPRKRITECLWLNFDAPALPLEAPC